VGMTRPRNFYLLSDVIAAATQREPTTASVMGPCPKDRS
jgi:hypothetical protein